MVHILKEVLFMNIKCYFLFFIVSNISLCYAMNPIPRTGYLIKDIRSNEQILHCIQLELNEAGLGGDLEVERLVPGLQYNVQRLGPGIYSEEHGPVLGVVASHGFTHIAEMLLEAGAFVDERSSLQNNTTPLMRTVVNHEHLNMVELLLAHKADPLAIDRQGNTACKLAKKWLAFMKETHESKNKIIKQKAIIERLVQAEETKNKDQFTRLTVF